jgi:hypothetical protein
VVLQYAMDIVTWLENIEAEIGKVEHVSFPAVRRVP